MLLYNEDLKRLNVATLKNGILKGLDKTDVLSQTDIENELGKYYTEAQRIDATQYKAAMLKTSSFSIGSVGSTILDKIKGFVCSVVTAASSDDDIIDAILKALASVIPGGIIFQFVAQILIKYILNLGVSTFCAVA